jgi:DNA-binding GntR family transcriptional regulator
MRQLTCQLAHEAAIGGKVGFDANALTDIEGLSGSLAQRVYQSLRAAILSMNYAPGAILPKAEICARLGVSRSPVSEAIARLSAEGLVDVIPQSVTRVSRFSMEEIREATFLREALELAAVEKVAAERTDAQLARLTHNLRVQELLLADGDHTGFFGADEDFHALVMALTGFAKGASVVEIISLQLRRARMLILPDEGRLTEVYEEHAAIIDAIRGRDRAAARAAMQHHLGQLISRIEPLEKQLPDYFRTR